MLKEIVRNKYNLYNKIVFLIRQPSYVEMPKIKGKIYLSCDKKAVSFGKNARINSSLESNSIGGIREQYCFVNLELESKLEIM